MLIELFKEVTTEDVISSYEERAAEYEGLYVDMENLPERKFVKEHAADIKGLRAKLNRARIDLTKQSKLDIDAEFSAIDTRLAKANEPFTLLMDDYQTLRNKVLADEKARKQAIIDAGAMEADHEYALLMDEKYTLAIALEAQKEAEAELERVRERDELVKQAVIDADIRSKQAIEDAKQAAVYAEIRAKQAAEDAEIAKKAAEVVAEQAAKQAVIDSARAVKDAEMLAAHNAQVAIDIAEADRLKREKNIEHMKDLLGKSKSDLMAIGLDEALARKVVLAIKNNQIRNISLSV